MNWSRISRKIHYWGAACTALPVLVVIVSGLMLLLKKDVDWIQPPTRAGKGGEPVVALQQILEAARKVDEAGIAGWEDIQRMDFRPDKGMVKVLAKTGWELQLDTQDAAILQNAFRRSDLIESIHDGSFFHDKARLWVFFPSGLVLLLLWVTGIVLWLVPMLARAKRKSRSTTRKQMPG